MFSSTLTTRKTIKWTVIHVLIGKIISTKSSMVENNRNSTRTEHSNIVIVIR